MKKYFLFFLFVCMFAYVHSSVEFDDLAGSVRTFWNDSNGLPSNVLLDIVQDDIGYIWLASYDGLIRFDGFSFTEFTKAEHGFTGTSPRVLYKGVDGSLWIGTNTSGLYNYKNNKFIHYGTDSGLPDTSIRAISIDNNNKLYVGTAGGIAYLNDDGQFIPLSNEINKSLGIVSFILSVKNTLWVGSNSKNGIIVLKDEKVQTPTYLDELKDETLLTGYLDKDNSIWLGANSGKMFHIKDEKIETFDFETVKTAGINEFLRLKNGTLFVATYKGLGRFTDNGFDLFSEQKGLPDKLVSALCQDNEGNLWIAMKNAGVGKFSKAKFLDVTRASYLQSKSVHSVIEDADETLWYTSDNGLTLIKDKDISTQKEKILDSFVEKLKGARVRQVREDTDGSLLFATYSNYGLIILKKDGSTKTLTIDDGLPSNSVRFSYRDETGILWIGTTQGVAYYMDGRLERIAADVLPNSFILSMLRDHNGSLWVGTDGGGVAKFKIEDGDEGKLKITLERVFNTDNGLDGNIIFKITEDASDNLWFSTSTGLTLYKDGNFYSARETLNTANEQIFNFFPDKHGNAWIIEPKELMFVSIESFTRAVQEGKVAKDVVIYNKLDGIAGQPVANSWPYLTSSNKLFIPTSKGVSLCDPSYNITSSLAPPVVIENIFIDDKRFDIGTSKFNIPASTKRIDFRFTALSYIVPERIKFEYMLEGYDSMWLSSGTKREIGYTNLPPGNYVFKVRARNNDGVTNESGYYISFYKEPFFYQTIWFYILTPLFVVFLTFVLIKLRVKGLQRKTLELDKKIKEKNCELEDEKEKNSKLLANILPPSIMEELTLTGKCKPRLYSNVSVLFADLVGFTDWASYNSSEVVISQLNTIFSMFDKIIEEEGCERVKTLGGGYFACCGLKAETSHAEKLVLAAIKMQKSLDEINKESVASFKMKIAIDSGAVTGGIVGEQKYVFDIFGDVVNTCFGLQALTSPMGITISNNTASLLKEKYPLYKRPQQVLKGNKKCESYYVIYKDIPVKSGMNITSSWRALGEAFKVKDYAQARRILSAMDISLLEPDNAAKLPIIQKILLQSGN